MQENKKNLVIGAIDNYDFNKLKPYIYSLKKVCPNDHKTLIVFNATYDTVDEIVDNGFEVVAYGKDDKNRKYFYDMKMALVVLRFFMYYNYLNDFGYLFNNVIACDVGDIYFQNNPFKWLENNIQDKKIVVTSENIRYINEDWGKENFKQTFGPLFYELYKEKEIYNAGILSGKSEYMKGLFLNIFQYSLNRSVHNPDQAVLNFILNTEPFKSVTKFCSVNDGYGCSLGTSLDDNYNNNWQTYQKYNILDVPKFENNLVKTSNGKEFSIVHQYNRNKEIYNYIKEEFV